ncbi:MAG TPA: hypothetical protein VLH35_01695 [Candidatus Acidoferrales bacterium]|nr:hypothetical protein [Candidatus Acidoferrales bacterium]
MPKPSVPEFNVAILNSPYTVTDPYTGFTQQIDNSSIELIIKNQPFTTQTYPSTCINTSLFYCVQVKGYYTDNWTDVYSSGTFTYTPGWNNNNNYTWYDYPAQSNSEYTTLHLPVWYPVGSKVDFRVQAIIANVTELLLPNFLPDNGARYHGSSDYTKKAAWKSFSASDWSTKTVTITADPAIVSTSPSPTESLPNMGPTSSSNVGSSDLVVTLAVVAILVSIVCVISLLLYVRYLKKRLPPRC